MNQIKTILSLFLICFSCHSYGQRESYAYTDTSFDHIGTLMNSYPDSCLGLIHFNFERTNDFTWKLLEVQCLSTLSRYNESVAVALEGVDYSKNNNRYSLQASFYLTLGNTYIGMHEFEKSKSCLEAVLKINNGIIDPRVLFLAKSGLARVENELGNPDKSIEIYEETIRKVDSMNNPNPYFVKEKYASLCNIGIIHMEEGRIASSIPYLYESKHFFEEDNDLEFAYSSYSGLANAYLEMNENDSTLLYLEAALDMARRLNSPNMTETSFKNLKDFYRSIGELELALQYGDSAEAYRSQYISDEYEKELAISSAQLNVHIKDLEIENTQLQLQEKQQQFQKESLKNSLKQNQKNYFIFILLSASVLLIVIVWLLNYIRKQNRRNLQLKLASLELKSLKSQLNPHFVFNCLNSIQYLFLADNKTKANKYLNEFAFLLRQSLENSDKAFVSLQEELKLLQAYCALENLQFDYPITVEIIDQLDTDDDKVLVPSMIFQPFIENCFVHAFDKQERNGKIQIVLSKKQETLLVTITDNGKGLSGSQNTNKAYQSKGTQISRERINTLTKMWGTVSDIKMENSQDIGNSGTKITLLIPQKL